VNFSSEEMRRRFHELSVSAQRSIQREIEYHTANGSEIRIELVDESEVIIRVDDNMIIFPVEGNPF
jgi:hypothetical protein